MMDTKLGYTKLKQAEQEQQLVFINLNCGYKEMSQDVRLSCC